MSNFEFLQQSGAGSREDVDGAREEAEGLGLFVRSLVGLDREAAQEAFGEFSAGAGFGANQLRFLALVAEQLTRNGVMAAERLFESPFSDEQPHGIVAVLDVVRQRATADKTVA